MTLDEQLTETKLKLQKAETAAAESHHEQQRCEQALAALDVESTDASTGAALDKLSDRRSDLKAKLELHVARARAGADQVKKLKTEVDRIASGLHDEGIKLVSAELANAEASARDAAKAAIEQLRERSAKVAELRDQLSRLRNRKSRASGKGPTSVSSAWVLPKDGVLAAAQQALEMESYRASMQRASPRRPSAKSLFSSTPAPPAKSVVSKFVDAVRGAVGA